MLYKTVEFYSNGNLPKCGKCVMIITSKQGHRYNYNIKIELAIPFFQIMHTIFLKKFDFQFEKFIIIINLNAILGKFNLVR